MNTFFAAFFGLLAVASVKKKFFKVKKDVENTY